LTKGKDEFVGTWTLASFESRRSDGQIVYPYGRDGVGVISYDAKGNMSVQLMHSDRPVFTINDQRKGTPEEIKVAFEGYMAYFGTYEVNEEKGTVTHHVKGSMFPNWVGSDKIRFFEFSGNRLTLRTPLTQMRGTSVTTCNVLIWERMT
jgi:hypothetical protein